MRLLVIGASGFIGRHIYSLAKERGYHCLGTRRASKDQDLLEFDLSSSQSIMQVVPGDFFETNEPVRVIICSALCKLDKCYYEREQSHAINVSGTIRLMDELKRNKIPFVFISTEFVFDGLEGYYAEDAPVSPVNEYGRQKVEVEEHIQGSCQDDLILRLSKVVGDEPGDEHFFSDCYKKVLRNEPIHCIEGQMFSPTAVEDVAAGIFRALELKLKGLYHLTNFEYFHRDELARQFLKVIGKNVPVIAQPLTKFGFPESRSLKTYLDGTRFRNATGMQFTTMKEVMGRFAAKIR